MYVSPGKPNHWAQEGHYLIPKNLIFIKIQYFTYSVDIDEKSRKLRKFEYSIDERLANDQTLFCAHSIKTVDRWTEHDIRELYNEKLLSQLDIRRYINTTPYHRH